MTTTTEQTAPPSETPAPTDKLAYNTTANKLTAVRILFVPLVVACLFQDTQKAGLAAAIFFGIAALTDWADGYYARTRQAITVLGKLMDPLADKFLVVSSLVMLLHLERVHPVAVTLLICREMAITGLRAIASAEGIVIAASNLAKWKTVTQMIAIPMLMLPFELFGLDLLAAGRALLWVSLGISLWSAKDYIVDFFRALHAHASQRREEKRAKRAAKRAARIRRIMEKDPAMAAAIREAASGVDLDKPKKS